MAVIQPLQIKLTHAQKRSISKLAGLLTIASESFSKAGEVYEKSKFKDIIKSVLPWSEELADSLGPIALPLKLLNLVLAKATNDTDPLLLGHLSCTIAYEKAIKIAIGAIARPEGLFDEASAQLALIHPGEEIDLSSFDHRHPLDHDFSRQAELRLQTAALMVGYTGRQIEPLTIKVREHFPRCLHQVLTDTETRERFKPFYDYLQLGTSQQREAFHQRQEHLKYQRWLYEEAPVLGRSPFALKDIYVETECGVLTYGKIRESKRIAEKLPQFTDEAINPFVESELCGGRHPLLKTVLDLIADPLMKEAIIIQGVAGAGKSSFTLRLCIALQQEQLNPIWIRLKDLDLTRNIEDSLPAAVKISLDAWATKNFFEEDRIFKESGVGRFDKICRHVLILDGWDEISVSDEGFQKRLNKMLEQIQLLYLRARSPLVRVILTGRPTTEVADNTLLRDNTPVLTLRPLCPNRLAEYVERIANAMKERPIDPMNKDATETWREVNPAKFTDVINQYRREYQQIQGDVESIGLNEDEDIWDVASATDHLPSSMAILGLPLLAHLTIRLISESKGDPRELVKTSTKLYRNLVDFTCGKSGKAPDALDEADDLRRQQRFFGEDLRSLLHQTASAMSVFGKDIIGYSELEARLNVEGRNLSERAEELTKACVLSSLMISFYFKGGHEYLGCEFVHKSFREYLFAEAIIEELKRYGRDTSNSKRPLEERAEYWRDFERNDPRYNLSRRLSELLAPQWLKPEVAAHLENLIVWEIDRAEEQPSFDENLIATAPLNLGGWRRVRDALADIWDWWGDGAHLRPQVKITEYKDIEYSPPYVCHLIRYSAPLIAKHLNPQLSRTTTMDAHIGDGLCRLCALIHHRIALAEGWPGWVKALSGNRSVSKPRRYQSSVSQDELTWILFAPSGQDGEYFANYANRINSSGWYPSWNFPYNVTLSGVDLSHANLVRASLEGVILNDANLNGANLDSANLVRAKLMRTSLNAANLNAANLENASLIHASLIHAKLIHTILDSAILDFVILDGATLDDASLARASLARASLVRASLDSADLFQSNFEGANLTRARLAYAKLDGAIFDGAILDGAILDGAILNGAIIDRADLSKGRNGV